jgi:predicted TIM-barrel fold metal-dependent hydrolase
MLLFFSLSAPYPGGFLSADENAAALPQPGQRFSLAITPGDRVLDITTNAVGRDLQLYKFHGRIGQRFYLQSTPVFSDFNIVAEISGYCLGEGKDGMVIVTPGTAKKSQRWRFIAAPGGGVRIVNSASGKVITCVDSWRGLLRDIDPNLVQTFVFRPIVTEAFQQPRKRPGLSRVPIIDVHTHIMNMEKNADFIAIGGVLEKKYDTRIDIWVDLDSNFYTGWNESCPAESRKRYGERIQYVIQTGYRDVLIFKPEEITMWTKRGDVVGYKIWWGFQKGIDDPVNDPTYARMAEVGLPGASVHVAQPFFNKEFTEARWTEAMDRWERVLIKHPKLVAVMAHMGCLMIDEVRLTRLERMLKAYPNLNLDICYGLTEYCLGDSDRLRSFMIKYSDRILFGSDLMSKYTAKNNYDAFAAQYERTFRILETDEYVTGSTFLMGGNIYVYRGLNLPPDVLEKIYYKNALRIYPGMRKALNSVTGGSY